MSVLSRRVRAAVVGATITGGVAALCVVQPAVGATESPVQRDNVVTAQARMQRQRPLVAAASVLRWAVERHAYAGYAGIALEDNRVALWWKGALPAAMTAVVARAGLTAPVQVRAAAHSLAELTAAAAKLRTAATVGPDAALHTIKLPADGSGLVVGAALPAGPTALAAAATRLPDVGVPVTVVHEEPLTATSRDDDHAPWGGGATIVNTRQSTACTSGFGVRNSSNAKYILTAGHCGQVGDRFTDAKGKFIGDVGPRNQDHDVELVPTSDVRSTIYTGDRNSAAELPVEDWGWTFIGEYLCQSGTTSAGVLGGPVCNIKVLFYWADREDLVEGEQIDGQPAARSGDSGGPVYSVGASGRAIAKGTVTRAAGARIGFQDFGTAWRDFGITPAT